MVLETPRLTLRPFELRDARALAAILGDEEVMRFSISGPMTPGQTWAFIRRCRRAYREDGVGPWAMVHRGDGAVIGYCGLMAQRVAERREIEIVYRLARPRWGRGLATEAARAVLEYGLGPLGLRRVVALIEPLNRPSARVAEKLGMRREGNILFKDLPVDLYALEVAEG